MFRSVFLKYKIQVIFFLSISHWLEGGKVWSDRIYISIWFLEFSGTEHKIAQKSTCKLYEY